MKDTTQNESAPEAAAITFKEDPRKLLCLHPADARRILIEPEKFKTHIGNEFVKDSRKLFLFHEALQSSLKGITKKKSLPSLKELSRYLLLYKRSVSDHTPIPTEKELLQQAIVLAGRDTPFLHILRKPTLKLNNEITFETTLIAPTESDSNKVIYAYKSLIQEAKNTLKVAKSTNKLGDDFIEKLIASLKGNSPEPRIGRLDYELHKIYLSESSIDASETLYTDFKSYVKRVNQEIGTRIYHPLLLECIKDGVARKFSYADFHIQEEPNSEKVSDIIHFDLPSYLKKRYSVLSDFFTEDFFGKLWDQETALILENSLTMGKITKNQFQLELAQALLRKIKQHSQASSFMHLFYLALEMAKLAEWKKEHELENERKKRQADLDAFLKKVKEAGNIYQVRDEKWIGNNQDVLKEMLLGNFNGVLACTEPYLNPMQIKSGIDPLNLKADIFLIIKDKKITAKAIETAEKLLERTGDTFLIRVLENLFQFHKSHTQDEHMKSYIAPAYINRLHELIQRSYRRYLSWWSRFLYIILGREISARQIKKIRAMFDRKQIQEINKRLKKTKSPERIPFEKELNQIKKESQVNSQAREKTIEEYTIEELELMQETYKFLKQEWENKRYPNEDKLLNWAGDKKRVMRKLLHLIDLDVSSTKAIISIPINGVGKIYAPRNYLFGNLDSLLEYFNYRLKEESVYKIQGRTYIAPETKGRLLHEGLSKFLKEKKTTNQLMESQNTEKANF